MSRFFRFVAEFANIFHGMFGTGTKRPFSRASLEDLLGPVWTRIILAIPAVTVTVWIGVWIAAKLLDLPAGEDPFAWMRHTFGRE